MVWPSMEAVIRVCFLKHIMPKWSIIIPKKENVREWDVFISSTYIMDWISLDKLLRWARKLLNSMSPWGQFTLVSSTNLIHNFSFSKNETSDFLSNLSMKRLANIGENDDPITVRDVSSKNSPSKVKKVEHKHIYARFVVSGTMASFTTWTTSSKGILVKRWKKSKLKILSVGSNFLCLIRSIYWLESLM